MWSMGAFKYEIHNVFGFFGFFEIPQRSLHNSDVQFVHKFAEFLTPSLCANVICGGHHAISATITYLPACRP